MTRKITMIAIPKFMRVPADGDFWYALEPAALGLEARVKRKQ